MKTGVIGGTFDPPHKGHIQIARDVKNKLGLDLVVFMVAGSPRLKNKKVTTPVEERTHMTNLAIKGESGFAVSTLEAERPGPTYTIETLKELEKHGLSKDDIYLILGWDNLVALKNWHQPQEIIRKCYIVAAPRAGMLKPEIEQLEKELPGISARLFVLEEPVIDVSSSLIRERVRQGKNITGMLPEEVEAYIEKNKLYRA